MTLCLAILHQSRQPAPNTIVHSGISHHRSFKTCPHFNRTAPRHRSSIQIRVHVSRVLDHRSERLTKNAAYTMSRRSAPLGQIHLDVVECRWHSKTFPRQQLLGPYSGSKFGITYLSTQPLVVVAVSDNDRNSCNKIFTCCLNRYSPLHRASLHLSRYVTMQSEDNGHKYVMMCTPRIGNLQVVMCLYSEELCLQPNSLPSTVSSLAEDARVDTAALVGCGHRHRVVVNQLLSRLNSARGIAFHTRRLATTKECCVASSRHQQTHSNLLRASERFS